MTTPIKLTASDPVYRWRRDHQEDVVEWLAANSLDANDVEAVTIHADRIEVVECLRDENGRHYLDPADPHRAATETRTVPLLVSLPTLIEEALRP